MAKSYDDWRKTIKNDAAGDSEYQAAKRQLDQTTATQPTYKGTYDNDVADAYRKLINRPEFEYSLDDDSLYKQYADKYMQAGKLAMKDTMGQAAALTGGYGSSYGQKVGQQTYDQYLQGLGDVALDMYDRAYGRYKDEGDRLKDAFGLAGEMSDTEYGRYMDAFNQWNNERGYWTDRADTAYGRAYQTGSDAYARSTAEADQEYNRTLDQAQTLAAYGDFSGFAALFGSDRAAEMQKVWNAGNPDMAYNTGRISAEEYRAMTGQYPAGYDAGDGAGGNFYDSYYYKNVLKKDNTNWDDLEKNYTGNNSSKKRNGAGGQRLVYVK
jgi:hypothetical protein